MRQQSIYALYIGTTKIALMKGAIQEDGTQVVERFIKTGANGFERGLVANIEKAALQVKELIVKGIGQNVDYKKIDFHVVISNQLINNCSVSSSVYFGDTIRTITRSDVQRVIAQTKSVATIPLEEFIISSTPQEFIVNDMGGILDPMELEAKRLGVKLLLFTVNSVAIRNVIKALERVDIYTDSFIPRALASSYACLREEERRDGIVLIDIGGHATDIMYVKNAVVQRYGVVPFGGETITTRLADAISITPAEARRLKEKFGSAEMVTSFDDEIIPVVDAFGKTRLTLNKKRLFDCILTSTKELLLKMVPVVDELRKECGTITGIVATGGGAALEGMIDVMQEVFGVPVRLGVTRKINGPKEVITAPHYTALTGVLGYVYDTMRRDEQRFMNKGFFSKKILQVREWIQEYF